jgi:hypothetical protein
MSSASTGLTSTLRNNGHGDNIFPLEGHAIRSKIRPKIRK